MPMKFSRLSALCGSASLFALSSALPALAQNAMPQVAQAPEAVPEQVLVTGSLIHGTEAVGVPVTNFGTQDFNTVGALTTSDLFKTLPIANVPAFQSSTDAGSKVEQTASVNLRGLSTKGSRTLMLIDGFRFPSQGDSGCQIDPSIIPQLALDRIDVLADGASATYGSDAIAGVINVILRRGYEGAITEGAFGFSPDIGHDFYRGSILYGTKWNSGDITVTYEYYTQDHVRGTARPYFTQNFGVNGLDNRTSIADSRPGTISTGAPALPTVNPNTGTNPATNVPGIPGSFSATTGTSCSNCYAIPAGQNGQGLTWSAILANTPMVSVNGVSVPLGTKNEINAYSDAWEEPGQQRSAVVLTFDQNVMEHVQFFADGFYDNRRSEILNATGPNSPAPAQNNALVGISVPTTNPYYPTGAPTNLRVSYDFGLESPVHIAGNEIAGRYDMGLNIELPYNWTGKVYGVVSQDREYADENGLINPGQVSAALGWTVPAGSVLASFTKPSNVPYLNLFCDPTQFTCNSRTTLNYLNGFRNYFEEMIIHEYGATADGSVLTLPGGDLKMAIGGAYDHFAYKDEDNENYNMPGTAQVADLLEYERRTVWAGFAQVNVPVIGENNQLPLVERFEVEGSLRYDNYSDVGSTTNPKVSADWLVADGLKLTGAWGTSFRAPSFQESGFVSGTLIQPINQAAGAGSNNIGTCPVVGQPAVAGSIAALIDPNCTQALQNLGGIRLSNGAGIASAVRPAGFQLQPEKAQNISAGFDFAPDDPILKGLDVNMTYYFIKIRNKLQGCAVGSVSGQLDDPNFTSCYVTGVNNPNFQSQVLTLLTNARSQLPGVQVATNISYIADGAIRNIGWQSVNGVDFNASYVYDAGDWGAWNTGVTGNYVLDNYAVNGPGQPVISVYSTPNSGTRNSPGRLNYRARLGWSGGPDGAFSITGFMNFIGHFNGNGLALPPLCFLQGDPTTMLKNPTCASYGPQFAQYTQQYPTLSNYIPSLYTFDLSLQYRTGDVPANTYLKNIGITLAINDITNKAPAFQYSVSTGSNTPHAFWNTISADQRYITIVVTKAW